METTRQTKSQQMKLILVFDKSRGKPSTPGKKAPEARVKKQQTGAMYSSFKPRIEPETQNWWKVNTLTTVPTQLPRKNWENTIVLSLYGVDLQKR